MSSAVTVSRGSRPTVAAPQASQPAKSPRLHYIDGLRATAMFMVLFHHCYAFGASGAQQIIGSHAHWLALAFTYGRVGVNLFLVLSGFCLYWPFVTYSRLGGREPTLLEFAKKRCRRILPAYYVCLFLLVAQTLWREARRHTLGSTYIWHWLAWHVVLLHNLRPDYIFTDDGSLWSLGLEWQLYIFFPLLVECFRRFPGRVVVLGAFAMSLAVRTIIYTQAMPLDAATGDVLAWSVFGRIFEFALGMYAASVIAQWLRERRSPLGVVDYAFAAAIVIGGYVNYRLCGFGYAPMVDITFGAIFAVLLIAASRAHTLLHRALSARPMVTMGKASYSIYLVHLPIMISLFGLMGRLRLSSPAQLAMSFLAVLPLSLGAGYLFFLAVERPFLESHAKVGARPVAADPAEQPQPASAGSETDLASART